MEENVWPLPGIIEKLRNDYVVVSLYVDEKVRLFPDNNFAYLLDQKPGKTQNRWVKVECLSGK